LYNQEVIVQVLLTLREDIVHIVLNTRTDLYFGQQAFSCLCHNTSVN